MHTTTSSSHILFIFFKKFTFFAWAVDGWWVLCLAPELPTAFYNTAWYLFLFFICFTFLINHEVILSFLLFMQSHMLDLLLH